MPYKRVAQFLFSNTAMPLFMNWRSCLFKNKAPILKCPQSYIMKGSFRYLQFSRFRERFIAVGKKGVNVWELPRNEV